MNDYYAFVPEIAESEQAERLAVMAEVNEALAEEAAREAHLDFLLFQEQAVESFEEREGMVSILRGETCQELIDERNAFERDERRQNAVEFGENPEALEAVLAARMGRGF
jgi:hypothetical protein